MKGHDCDTTYCSKCHLDRVHEATRQGQIEALRWCLGPKRRIRYKWQIEDSIARLEAGGQLEEGTP